MIDYLVDHARRDVWCAPRMDRQVILQARRVTPSNGARIDIKLMWEQIPLPSKDARYHVFQIGQIYPALLGLLTHRRVWYRLSYAMQQDKLMGDVYLNDGRQLPRFETWLLLTEDRALLMAVRDQPSIPDVRTEPVYMRLYSNAFFSSERSDDYDHRIEVVGHRYTNLNDALLFQQNYMNHRTLRGLTTLFINGRYVSNMLPQSLVAGDVLEFVYDSTVKQVLEFPIASTESFESEKDLKRKFLLTHGGDQIGGQIIDYRDDIDVYLVRKSMQGSTPVFRGVYFHKNQDDALRQVTHRDYSVTASYLDAYLEDHPWLGQQTDVTVRLHVREAGLARPLIFEHHRIHELYKLPYADRHMAMVGTESSVDVWKASALENSPYVRIMDSLWPQITRPMVQDAYGYNSIALLTANTPLKVELRNGDDEVVLPYALRFGATMFEFDTNGVLLGHYYYASGAVYHPKHSNTTLVEAVVGRGGYRINTVFGQPVTTLNPSINYRFYIAPVNSQGVDHTRWQDVTGDQTKYVIIDGAVHWLIDQQFWGTAVKGDDEFLAYTMTMSPFDGLLKFSIDGQATYPGGSAQGIMYIPVGKLDLWLNGKALIENLDYYVRWPELVIINKEYLVAGNAQKITVRASGFCKPDMTREAPPEFGFVKYGLLSRNRRYNVRDDRVLRMVVRGRTFHRDELKFSETDSGLYMDNVENGSPYMIDDVVVPLRDMVGVDTYTFRERSRVVDKQVEDYLSLKLPEPVEVNPNMIPKKYWVYSPFCSVVMYHLIAGIISMDDFRGQYSDHDVRQRLQPYAYLLPYDPCSRTDILTDLVAIHPHNRLTEQVLDIYQYNFLNRAIKIFLDDKVDITQFIVISETVG